MSFATHNNNNMILRIQQELYFLKSEFNQVIAKMNSLSKNSTIVSIQEAIAELEQKVESLGEIGSLSSEQLQELLSLKTIVDALQAKLAEDGEVMSLIGTLQEKLQALEEDEGISEETQEKLTELEEKIKALEEDKTLEQLQETVQQLKEDLEAKINEIPDWTDTITTLQTTVGQLPTKEDISSLEDKISEIEKELANDGTFMTLIGTLQDDISAHDTRIKALENDTTVEELQADVEELQADVKDIQKVIGDVGDDERTIVNRLEELESVDKFEDSVQKNGLEDTTEGVSLNDVSFKEEALDNISNTFLAFTSGKYLEIGVNDDEEVIDAILVDAVTLEQETITTNLEGEVVKGLAGGDGFFIAVRPAGYLFLSVDDLDAGWTKVETFLDADNSKDETEFSTLSGAFSKVVFGDGVFLFNIGTKFFYVLSGDIDVCVSIETMESAKLIEATSGVGDVSNISEVRLFHGDGKFFVFAKEESSWKVLWCPSSPLLFVLDSQWEALTFEGLTLPDYFDFKYKNDKFYIAVKDNKIFSFDADQVYTVGTAGSKSKEISVTEHEIISDETDVQPYLDISDKYFMVSDGKDLHFGTKISADFTTISEALEAEVKDMLYACGYFAFATVKGVSFLSAREVNISTNLVQVMNEQECILEHLVSTIKKLDFAVANVNYIYNFFKQLEDSGAIELLADSSNVTSLKALINL